jgi:hypothetical protein
MFVDWSAILQLVDWLEVGKKKAYINVVGKTSMACCRRVHAESISLVFLLRCC